MQNAANVYSNSIFLFHRDLRLQDNTALNAALRQSREIFPCFILDKTLLKQLDNHLPRIQYMLAALQELDISLRELGSQLYVVYDTPVAGLMRLQKTFHAEAVFFHRDASAYSTKRNSEIDILCQHSSTACHILDDITLHPPEQTLKADGSPYTVFTPFFRRAFQLTVRQPQKMAGNHFAKKRHARIFTGFSDIVGKHTIGKRTNRQ